ncbi:MAG: hypothetical protein N3D84_01945, partial [Candidatus Woesearchaeota archaeon]|nr:hypothetical protein [Candidatus Woesearchaeota archaeon]
LFIVFIFVVGSLSGASGEAIIISFVPTIIFIIIAIVLMDRSKPRSAFQVTLLLLPAIFAFFFYFIATSSNIELFKKMEIGKISFLNAVLSYGFVLFVKLSDALKKLDIGTFVEQKLALFEEEKYEKSLGKELEIGKAPENVKKEKGIEGKEMEGGAEEKIKSAFQHPSVVEVPVKESEREEDLPTLIHSIESNCKALNAVIGRVYRKSNGGTDLMRDVIEVKSEWYNEFNDLLKKRDLHGIYEIVDKIERRLDYLFRKEKELFGKTNLRNLKRDPEGNDKIIDVLIMNDNDPVETYFENALILCGKVKEIISKAL